MFKKATPIIIKALSPIHAGSGRELGIVDMPIQRESHSGVPKIEGSSIKGSLREWTRLKKETHDVNKLFGATDGNEQAGLIGFSDAKLLFYPIKSLQGIFAYVTCPYLLDRFFVELKYIKNYSDTNFPKYYNQLKELLSNNLLQGQAIIAYSSETTDDQKQSIELDEYSFVVKENLNDCNSLFKSLGLQPQRSIAVLCDEDFMEMISLCKEIITRNKIDHKTGTVAEGQLFTEEYLPAESILYTLLLVNGIESKGSAVENYVQEFACEQICQIGGNSNIGKGIVNMQQIGGGKNGEESKK